MVLIYTHLFDRPIWPKAQKREATTDTTETTLSNLSVPEIEPRDRSVERELTLAKYTTETIARGTELHLLERRFIL
ncbi:hypothetical protein [Oxynema aestuarii]|jgi:hypothetical protein|uniref:Uncharacterized protein n=1 Tax=Oxynema aestuarii AP17 TaxID=2064643 RepID=A0A6H1TWS8_9CYAN|nr:hypothetical protein [Oxynema aestuarii]QIZ71068.1 hypothetical protein HCG48_11205 [Oxynema aestuarii AP17]